MPYEELITPREDGALPRVSNKTLWSWYRCLIRADPRGSPIFNALSMRLQKELMRFKGDRIVITTKPYHHVEIPLTFGPYQKRFIEAWENGELRSGEVTLLEDRAIVTFKRTVEEKNSKGYISIYI